MQALPKCSSKMVSFGVMVGCAGSGVVLGWPGGGLSKRRMGEAGWGERCSTMFSNK